MTVWHLSGALKQQIQVDNTKSTLQHSSTQKLATKEPSHS
jgi:hypothetical protein